jgi:serine phosphatase RsbU (regulator of sigma subunit)/anti-sigma regulatory factor (Ser/Thr protein kinase)
VRDEPITTPEPPAGGAPGGAEDAILSATLETLRRAVEDVEVDRSLAEALQRNLLADRLPETVGFNLAARYIPGGAAGPIGGDWYDAVPLRGGRLGVVIGDVVGHGVSAAARMARLQSAMRAYALQGLGPGESLRLMNAFVREDEAVNMATVLTAVVDPDSSMVTIASAGHLAPLVIVPNGDSQFLEIVAGSPLGALEFPTYEEITLPIEPDSTLVLFTDGLVERREDTLATGLERLRLATAGWSGEAEDLCDAVLAAMLDGTAPHDDVAVVAVDLLPPAGSELTVRMVARPSSLIRARRELGRWLRGRGALEEEVYELLVAVGEACANAVAHAYPAGQEGRFEIDAREADRDVTIVVRDFGSWRPERPSPSRGLTIMRELTDQLTVSKEGPGTVVHMSRRLRSGA